MAHEPDLAERGSARVRLDVWLWSVRGYRTRTAATDACRSGRVTVNDEPAKAAQRIGSGDRVEFRRAGDRFVYVVVSAISKRVGAALAAEAFEDHSPPRIRSSESPADIATGERERGAGRPTKRDRRRIDALRQSGRDPRRA